MFETDGRKGATTLAITSGKGGVGKTSLATNLAIALRRHRHRVCLLDADMGLANANILLGLQAAYSLDDVKAGRVGLDDLILQGPEGVDILPAAAGLERLAVRSPRTEPRLAEALTRLESTYDYLLVDTPAGIGETTRAFIHPCDMSALVITPEPTSLTDAFTLMRTMLREEYAGELAVIVNMLPMGQTGEHLFERFQAAAQRFLEIKLHYLGAVPMDRNVTRAVVRQQPLLTASEPSPAAEAITELADRIRATLPAGRGAQGFTTQWAHHAEAANPAADDVGEGDTAPRPAEAVPSRDTDGSDIPAVVTAPEPFTAAPAWTLDELAEAAESLLARPDLDESAARQFFGRLERRFSERFRRRSGDIKTLLYESLLQDHLSEEQLREIRDVLVETYARRFDAYEAPPPTPSTVNVDDLETRIAALYSAATLDEARSRALMSLLAACHTERFGSHATGIPDGREQELQALKERFESQRRALEARLTETCLLIDEQARLLSEADPAGHRDCRAPRRDED